jgi:hypothetical protein
MRGDILGLTRSGIRSWQPSGGIPDPASLGPVSQENVAPELTLQVTGSRVMKFWLGGRWQASGGLALWAQGEYASLTPTEGAVSIPMEPSGDRSGWTPDIGALLVSSP